MRLLYTLLLYLIAPILFLRLLWRSRHLPAYRHRLAERIGFYPKKLEKCIWIHAVSVGEVVASQPLIQALQQNYANIPFVITTMTPTGAARVKTIFGDSVTHYYLPYDFPDAIKRFLNTVNPVIGLIIETELWPNVLTICKQKNTPVCLLNARLSEKSAKRYRMITSLTKHMLQCLTLIAAISDADAARFIAAGANEKIVVVTGNIKFDLALNEDAWKIGLALRETIGNRFTWIAASTHQGEEEIILAAHKLLLKTEPSALLILVPRHPDRFQEVAAIIEQQDLRFIKRTQNKALDPDMTVYLADTMGELLLLYAAADVAFVGGSLVPRGGHNMLEPAAFGKTILTGPHLFNFTEISQKLLAANAMQMVNNASELSMQLLFFMNHADARDAFGQRALAVMNHNRGALQKQLRSIKAILADVLPL